MLIGCTVLQPTNITLNTKIKINFNFAPTFQSQKDFAFAVLPLHPQLFNSLVVSVVLYHSK